MKVMTFGGACVLGLFAACVGEDPLQTLGPDASSADAAVDGANGVDGAVVDGTAESSVPDAGSDDGAPNDALVAADGANAGLAKGLLAYWPLENGGNDASGNGRDLTLVGGPAFAPGVVGNGLALTGDKSKYATRSITDAVFDFGTAAFTLQVWVKYASITGEQTLIEKLSGSSGPGWAVTTADNTSALFYGPPGYTTGVGPLGTPTAGVFHHILVRRTATDVTIHYDGALHAKQTQSAALTSSTNPLLIGKRNEGDGRGFAVNGILDEIAIWDRALSDVEVAVLYGGGAGHAIVP